MLAAESSVLSEMLLDDSVSVFPITNVTAFELMQFIVCFYGFFDADGEHSSEATHVCTCIAFAHLQLP